MCHTCQIHSKYNIDIILVKKKPKHCNTVEFLEKKKKEYKQNGRIPKNITICFYAIFQSSNSRSETGN